jgi:hypothetical protein
MVGSSYKSLSIETDKKSYSFSDTNSEDYPQLIAVLARKMYDLNRELIENSDGEWHNLKELKAYDLRDFNLRDDVSYLEIRLYTKRAKEEEFDRKYNVKVAMGTMPLSSFDARLVRKFKRVKPNLSNETNIKRVGFCLMLGCTHILGNGFMINKDKKIWTMNMREDIVQMIGQVDTPAEVRLVLWLHDKNLASYDKDEYQYKKVSDGYEILHKYTNTLSNIGECGHFTYEMFVTKDGKVSKNKFLTKSTKNVDCLAID